MCFVPYHIVRVFYIITQMSETSCYWKGVVDQANEVALLFSALNSCLDPVMYFLLSSPMRKQVMRLLGNVMRVWEAGASGSSYSVEQGSGSGRTVPRQQSTGLVGVLGNNTDDITSQP